MKLKRGRRSHETQREWVYDQLKHMLVSGAFAPGQKLTLARIASGGELSRVALAIKRVLAEADATPTLVFDEVDSGIGGRNADPLGRSLWSLARRHQVLCVTHLPQIASAADVHYRVEKIPGDPTHTRIERLDEAQRRDELERMLGGREFISTLR